MSASSSVALISVVSPALADEIPSTSIVGPRHDRTATEALARAEQMIEILRTRYINNGWKLDEVAAERVLQFFRTWVQFPTTHESQPGHDDELAFMIRFVSDHGQSLDWLIMGDVGNMICGAASRSRAAAAKMTDDPIIAAIEDHRNTYREYLEMFASDPDDNNKDPDFIARREILDDRADRAAEPLANIQPTTMNGVIALLAYVHEFNTGGVILPQGRGYYSDHEAWPLSLTDDEMKNPRGNPLEMPFPFWVMENVRAALTEIHPTA